MFRYAIAALAVLTLDSAVARPSHCTATEVAVFSCAIGRKIVSLCASQDLSEGAGYLQYRYGALGRRPELVHPEKIVAARDAFVGGTIDARGGDFVRFSKGDLTYTVQTALHPKRGEITWLSIQRGAKTIFDVSCRTDPLGNEGWARVYKAKLPRKRYHSAD